MITFIRIFCFLILSVCGILWYHTGFPELVWNLRGRSASLAAMSFFCIITFLFDPKVSRTIKEGFERTAYGSFVKWLPLLLIAELVAEAERLSKAGILNVEGITHICLLGVSALLAFLLTKATAKQSCDFCHNSWAKSLDSKVSEAKIYYCYKEVCRHWALNRQFGLD